MDLAQSASRKFLGVVQIRHNWPGWVPNISTRRKRNLFGRAHH